MNSIAVPGSRLGSVQTLTASDGTFIKGDHIYSSLYGKVNVVSQGGKVFKDLFIIRV